jgi:hypothetical protein
MSTSAYEEVLSRAQSLTPDEQLQLIEELAAIIRRQITARPKHSVTEFRRVGKEVWEGIDVEKYIEEERNSWE